MTEYTIPFGRPMLDEAEREAVAAVLSGTQLVHGPSAREFERRFAERIGTEHAVTVSSCTAGLHLSLLVHEIGPGDEVLVPAMTHVATAHAVEFCGAKPIFVDVEADSGNIDPGGVVGNLGGRCRAVMLVHYLGLPCDMGTIMAATAAHDAIVIEDCALAVDAVFAGRKVGTFGVTGCFSFYPVKHMTTLEGGMITTNDATIAAAVAQRKAFGYDRSLGERTRPGIYDVNVLGYNYRMNEVSAAVGLVQLDKIDDFQDARARNYSALRAALADIEELTIFEPVKGEAVSSHYCLNAILPRDGHLSRDIVVDELRAQGIGTSVHYPSAVPMMAYYREKYGYRAGQFPIAEWLADQTISLPVGPHLLEGDAERIGRAVKTAVHSARKATTTLAGS